jgi:hypothetical protein
MARVESDESPPFGFWDYFDRIPVADFQGHDCSDCQVEYVWRDSRQTGSFSDTSEHSPPDLFLIVKGDDDVWPASSRQCPVGA